MANSILANLTADNTVAEIKLLLAADYEKKRTVMLLEGEDDIKVFRFLVGGEVTLIKAYGASTTVDKLMPKHFPSESRVIGVRDRDYQKHKRFERVFYCDGCNCEMMLAADDETFERVAINFYRGKLSPLALRREILKKLYYLSVVRKCSEQYRWALRISDTDLSRLCSPRTQPNLDDTVAFVNSYNPRNRIDEDRRAIVASYDDTGAESEYFGITNGHDFIEVLRIYCVESRSDSRRRSLSDKILGGALRCAYSLSAFKRTQLCAQLTEYGSKHGLRIVKE